MNKLNELIGTLHSINTNDLKDELSELKSYKVNLLKRLPFKEGDKVELVRDIDTTHAPGWTPKKHLLVKGNVGTVSKIVPFADCVMYLVRLSDGSNEGLFHMKEEDLKLEVVNKDYEEDSRPTYTWPGIPLKPNATRGS